ncbi:AP2-like ethylene-responsive transcription factor ail7 [Stylosanthes scabra]|uniref:AP2-like ethylene-responsive transcription factor ail7 n=1 Tax=Stylosanthes scabra TaxID=79078 RepID=A0ABU6S5Z2_9FABA|nr:AP2-like ethylene-responsive transcription factor ail7 [Stylosanthes scabra]
MEMPTASSIYNHTLPSPSSHYSNFLYANGITEDGFMPQQQHISPIIPALPKLEPFSQTDTRNDHHQRAFVPADAPFSSTNSKKAVGDTFGHRTSIYRGVTRHRWTGRYEAHLWDNSCRREGQTRKGRQVYLGGYDKEEKAARAYDLAALKYWGPTATTNFPASNYTKELEEMKDVGKLEFIASLRRRSSGFSRGASIYRGVTRHHQQGRWQARIGRVAGNKDLYLGTFATEEEAAEAYDIAAIKFRGLNAVTNFEMSRYNVEAIMNNSLPIGRAAKRLKLSLESEKEEAATTCHTHPPKNESISTMQVQPLPPPTPFDSVTPYYHQFYPTDALNGTTKSAMASVTAASASTEFYMWPHQCY